MAQRTHYQLSRYLGNIFGTKSVSIYHVNDIIELYYIYDLFYDVK